MMPALLPLLMGFLRVNWKWVAIGALILMAIAYIALLRHQAASRADEIIQLQSAVYERDIALRALNQGYAANVNALTHELDATKQRAATVSARKEILAHANLANDKPAVILDDLLDGLHPAQAGAGGAVRPGP